MRRRQGRRRGRRHRVRELPRGALLDEHEHNVIFPVLNVSHGILLPGRRIDVLRLLRWIILRKRGVVLHQLRQWVDFEQWGVQLLHLVLRCGHVRFIGQLCNLPSRLLLHWRHGINNTVPC